MRSRSWSWLAAAVIGCACGGGADDPGQFEGELGTVLFVTQVPVGGLNTATAPFANHLTSPSALPRGGDLMIRYPDGTLRNLTREAGFGEAGELQGEAAIAVREPTVHWSGNRALFSMVVGAVAEQFQRPTFYWQVYEVTGLGREQQASIRRIDGQPAEFNNVSPVYGSDDRILFVSDRPRGGERHLYPQLDEYESQPTTVGIYRLDEASGELELVEHAPSGVFSLSVDSFGRVLFTKWDHLQRDQQADSLERADASGAVTFADESAGASSTDSIVGAELFPEPRDRADPAADPGLSEHRFNQFFPWEMNQDGSEEETLNHVGRQEWGGSYTDGSVVGDDNLAFEAPQVFRGTDHLLPNDGGTFQIRQDPTDPSWYLGTVAPEFGTATGGTLIRFQGDPSMNPEVMDIEPLTPTRREAQVPEDTGLFRNPLPMADGSVLAAHSAATQSTDEEDLSYRLVVLVREGDRMVAGPRVTEGIQRSVSWYTPDQLETWSGTLWELDPVEVAPRPAPPLRTTALPDVEMGVFDEVGVDPAALSSWLRDRELALVVSRNVTQRDRNDVQQPYNLEVPGGVSSVARDGAVYQVSHLQFFQGDLVRGYTRYNEGRRVLARPMRGADLVTDPDGPAGSVALGPDGSMAAFVPARRALSWQLVGPDGAGVVRERNWISFRAGEIRVCAACHGINQQSQTGAGTPDNPPAALRELLESWQASQ